VKVNYIGNSATIKRNEYGFTLVNFSSLIPILDQSFAIPLHVENNFFLMTCKKRVEGITTKKSLWEMDNWNYSNRPYRIWYVLTWQHWWLHMFINSYFHWGIHSIATIVGGSTIAPLGLYLVVREGEDDGINNAKESTRSCDNDG